MAEILSQEEIDALLDLVKEDNGNEAEILSQEEIDALLDVVKEDNGNEENNSYSKVLNSDLNLNLIFDNVFCNEFSIEFKNDIFLSNIEDNIIKKEYKKSYYVNILISNTNILISNTNFSDTIQLILPKGIFKNEHLIKDNYDFEKKVIENIFKSIERTLHSSYHEFTYFQFKVLGISFDDILTINNKLYSTRKSFKFINNPEYSFYMYTNDNFLKIN